MDTSICPSTNSNEETKPDACHPEKVLETANHENHIPVAFALATMWKEAAMLDGRPSGECFEMQQGKPNPSKAEHGQF